MLYYCPEKNQITRYSNAANRIRYACAPCIAFAAALDLSILQLCTMVALCKAHEHGTCHGSLGNHSLACSLLDGGNRPSCTGTPLRRRHHHHHPPPHPPEPRAWPSPLRCRTADDEPPPLHLRPPHRPLPCAWSAPPSPRPLPLQHSSGRAHAPATSLLCRELLPTGSQPSCTRC